MDKGKRITGAARDKLAAELKTAYESGASIRASPTTPHARTASSTTSSPRQASPCAGAAEPPATSPVHNGLL